MKKINIVIALALLGTQVYAQADGEENQLRFGFKSGINISNVYDAHGEQFDADAKLGFVAGMFLSVQIGSYIGIQPELIYSQKGYRSSGSLPGMDYRYTYSSDYIDVPLLFALRPVPFLTLLAGPQYSYLIAERTTFSNTLFPEDPIVEKSEFENRNVRKNVLGAVAGADVNLRDIVLSLRAGMDITNNNGNGTQTEPRYKNVYYQATVGYRF